MAQALPRRSLVLASTSRMAHGGVIREEEISFPARDGFPLRGTLYFGEESADPNHVVVFNAGAGFAYRRYRSFLRYLTLQGIPALAYDYRGIGSSRLCKPRDAGIEHWSELDQPAAVDEARLRYPGARIATISHSIGCLVAAIAPSGVDVHQMVFIAPHTGYCGDYRHPWRWPMTVFWHVFMPIAAQVLGYFPASRLGLGDDIPKRFALQWAGRTKPDIARARMIHPEIRDRLIQNARCVTAPVLLLTSDDDAFVGELACARFMNALPQVRVVRRHLESADFGGAPGGHTTFFRTRHSTLWPIVTKFLTAPWPSETERNRPREDQCSG